MGGPTTGCHTTSWDLTGRSGRAVRAVRAHRAFQAGATQPMGEPSAGQVWGPASLDPLGSNRWDDRLVGGTSTGTVAPRCSRQSHALDRRFAHRVGRAVRTPGEPSGGSSEVRVGRTVRTPGEPSGPQACRPDPGFRPVRGRVVRTVKRSQTRTQGVWPRREGATGQSRARRFDESRVKATRYSRAR